MAFLFGAELKCSPTRCASVKGGAHTAIEKLLKFSIAPNVTSSDWFGAASFGPIGSAPALSESLTTQ